MEAKVFTSEVTRVQTKTDDLYSLLKITPAVPITKKSNTTESKVAFEPKKDKYYLSKKKSKLKVKTVRDLRISYEKDIYDFLPLELEKQESLLLRKIKIGQLKEQNTKKLAKTILALNNPISRSSWQILMNINPDNKVHRQQCVLWNGKHIRINGSKGGRTKFLHKYDLHKLPSCLSKNKTNKSMLTWDNKKKNLLKTSVSIKFKPGPLSKKYSLDCSYQKHQVGKTELVKLPSPALEVYPSYGHALDPTITNYLHNMQDLSGTISQKWAELAASAIGTVKKGRLRKLSSDVIKFGLKYKNDQGRILMRSNGWNLMDKTNNNSHKLMSLVESDTVSEVKKMLNDMISSVEVSLNQENLFIVDEPRPVSESDINLMSGGDNVKDKGKRKYCELERLDVTVIQLSEEAVESPKKECKKTFCNLGCICPSLEYRSSVKGHCGKIECMFECKCDFSRFADYEKNPELLTRLVSLDCEINGKLAKEEQKFHQTVVMTGNKSIVLKSESRNLKIPEKYLDFYKYMCLKSKVPPTRMLSVISWKLDSTNIEPWCMVHSLYKCFCEGKFLDSNSRIGNPPESNTTVNESDTVEKCTTETTNEFKNSIDNTHSTCNFKNITTTTELEDNSSCSRVLPFLKRKYDLAYYKKLGRKIVDMESNDSLLQKKLLVLSFSNQHKFDIFDDTEEKKEVVPINVHKKVSLINVPEDNIDIESIIKNKKQHISQKSISEAAEGSSILIDDSESDSSSTKLEPKKLNKPQKWTPKNKTLVKWLEKSYKKYKEDIEQGIEKASLDPPKAGTMTLYPWDFILKRYRGRKNLFLVSKSPPYRIFIAVNMKHPLFENCININEIRYADLYKYPTTVKNLICNANDLTNHFFIFRGLSHCWELVGSVSKVDQKAKESEIQNGEIELPKLSLQIDDDDPCLDSFNIDNTSFTSNLLGDSAIRRNSNVEQSSKWFVMTIENDFSEIQFYRKGFFVKYDSIIKAINVSRGSGNTVRLSSVQQSDSSSTPHFGIYAIPNVNEYCVFIGPYEKNEPLGIETVKTFSDITKIKRTRGVWITTNKVDDLKVIDNPLDFMPTLNKTLEDQILLDRVDQETLVEPAAHSGEVSPDATTRRTSSTSSSSHEESSKKVTRIVIRKTNGFFKILPKISSNENTSEACENSDLECPQLMDTSKSSSVSNVLIRGNQISKKPIAEIAPQIKNPKNNFGRMSILKPEEINKKLLEKVVISEQDPRTRSEQEILENDVESFLATSLICVPPENRESHSEVWLQCKTIQGLGYIKGKLRDDECLSFEFPGFKFSPFYEKDEAVEKINQVLSRKVYVPKHINLEWEVVSSQDELTCKTLLKSEDLCSDMILTTAGLLHKRHLLNTKLAEAAFDAGDTVTEISESLQINSEDED